MLLIEKIRYLFNRKIKCIIINKELYRKLIIGNGIHKGLELIIYNQTDLETILLLVLNKISTVQSLLCQIMLISKAQIPK